MGVEKSWENELEMYRRLAKDSMSIYERIISDAFYKHICLPYIKNLPNKTLDNEQ
jgi:hypothetical protein